MAVIQHKIRFLADYREVTKQLEKAAQSLDKTLPALTRFREESDKLDKAWISIAKSIAASAASAKKVRTPKAGGTGGAGRKSKGGSGGGTGGGSAPSSDVANENLEHGWKPGKGWSGRGTKGPLDAILSKARGSYAPPEPKTRGSGRGLPFPFTFNGRALAGATGNLLATGAMAAGSAVASTVGGVIERGDKATNSKAFSVQEHGRLSAAAQGGDTNIDALEKASSKLTTTLASAQLPAEFKRGLTALGVSAKELKTLKPEDQFALLADRITDFKDPALQAAAAQKLFGDQGVELLPFLRQGGAGIKALGDEAERFGLVMSDEAAQAAADLNDQLDSLGRRAGGMANKMVGAAMPAISELVDGFAGLVEEAGPGLTEISELVGGALSEAVLFLTETFGRLEPVVGPLVSGLVSGLGDSVSVAFDTLSTAAEVLFQTVESVLEIFGITADNAGDTGAALSEGLGAAFAWVADMAGVAASAIGSAVEILGWLAKLLIDAVTGGEGLAATFGGIADVVTWLVTGALLSLQNVLAYVAELFDLFGSGDWIGGFRRLGEGLLDFILEPLRAIVSTVVSIADAISDDLVPDSVRSFANNSKIREFSDKHEAEKQEKRVHKKLALEDLETKRREQGAKKVEKAETEVSAKRMAALSQEGRKLSGPGLIDLGARDAQGRDVSVYIGNKARADLAAALLGGSAAGAALVSGRAAASTGLPALSAAAGRAHMAPVQGALGRVAPSGAQIHVQVGPVDVDINGANMDWPALESQIGTFFRVTLGKQIVAAVQQLNPGNLSG